MKCTLLSSAATVALQPRLVFRSKLRSKLAIVSSPQALFAFHAEHYSASRMRLVVLGKEPIAELEAATATCSRRCRSTKISIPTTAPLSLAPPPNRDRYILLAATAAALSQIARPYTVGSRLPRSTGDGRAALRRRAGQAAVTVHAD